MPNTSITSTTSTTSTASTADQLVTLQRAQSAIWATMLRMENQLQSLTSQVGSLQGYKLGVGAKTAVTVIERSAKGMAADLTYLREVLNGASLMEAEPQKAIPQKKPKASVAKAVSGAGRYTLMLANRGNPDHGDDPDRPVYGTPKDHLVAVDDFAQASRKSREYISEHDLGGGNWTGGGLTEIATGKQVGRVAYNGRIFDGNKVVYEPDSTGVAA